jgi:ssDNA-binding replication factor A large subunit
MSDYEKALMRIMEHNPQLTREDIEKLIEEEKARASNLLTDEAAAQILAAKMGVSRVGKRMGSRIRIGDLTSGLGDVSLSARIIYVFPPRRFKRGDGREGKVLRILLGDKTGTADLVLWDEVADRASAMRLNPGKMVRILHGYTRERRGRVEIHVGRRGEVYLETMDSSDEDYPPLESFFLTPGEVMETGMVNLEGVVVEKNPESSFQRSDGSLGKVARLTLEEGGGRINLVLWDEMVEEMGRIELGMRIRIINGAVRVREDGRPEIHLRRSAFLEVLEADTEPRKPYSPWIGVAELKPGMQGVYVSGRVAQIGDIREFKRGDGSLGRVVSILLRDDAGSISLDLWDDEVELLEKLKIGHRVSVEEGRVTGGKMGPSLRLGRKGRLKILSEAFAEKPFEEAQKIMRIRDLKEGQRDVTIRGRIIEAPELREVETSRGIVKVTSFSVEDETGMARISVWRNLADEAIRLLPGEVVRVENCHVRFTSQGLVDLTSGPFTKIKIENMES